MAPSPSGTERGRDALQTPDHLKTQTCEEAFNPDGLAQRSIALLKDTFPDLEVRRGRRAGRRGRSHPAASGAPCGYGYWRGWICRRAPGRRGEGISGAGLVHSCRWENEP